MADFSTVWKKVFHGVENPEAPRPAGSAPRHKEIFSRGRLCFWSQYGDIWRRSATTFGNTSAMRFTSASVV